MAILSIGTGMMMTFAAIRLLVKPASSCADAASSDNDAIATALNSLFLNWASSGIQLGSSDLLARLTDDSIDPDTHLPRNHDVQRASLDAMREAAMALGLGVWKQLKPDDPWLPAFTRYLSDGRFGTDPLIRAFDRPTQAWLRTYRASLDSERFVRWHNDLRLSEEDIRSCFVGGRFSLRGQLPVRFREWIEREEPEPVDPDARALLLSALENGWGASSGRAEPMRLDEIYSLYMRELIKYRPALFHLLIADATFATEGLLAEQKTRMETIETHLKQHADIADGLLNRLQESLEGVNAHGRLLQDRLPELLTCVTTLQVEFEAGRREAEEGFAAVREVLKRIGAEVASLRRDIFGLPLVQPLGAASDEERGDDLWVLRAKHRALPLVGRAVLMDELWHWLHSDDPVSVRLIVGRAGSGKTRLGYELIWRVAAECADLWDAGRIESAQLRHLDTRVAPTLWLWNKPTLVVVDYARAATEGLHVVLRELCRRAGLRGQPKLRLLLLERTQSATSDWIEELRKVESSDGGPTARTLFDGAVPIELPAVGPVAERESLFLSTLGALAGPAGGNDLLPPEERPALSALAESADWSEPIVPIMAAVAFHRTRSLRGVHFQNRSELADHVAELEVQRVVRFGGTAAENRSRRRLLLRVAALVTLGGGMTRGEALALADRESRALHVGWPDGVGDLVDGLASAWADPKGQGAIAALQPDLIAEAFVLGQLVNGDMDSDDVVRAVVDVARGHEFAAAGLVLRAFHNFHADARRADTLGQWAAKLTTSGLASREPVLLAALDEAIPATTIALREKALMVTVERQRLMSDLPTGAVGPCLEHSRIARRLALRHAALQQAMAATAAAKQAVAWCRQASDLAPHADPGVEDDIALELARSLTTLSLRLFDQDHGNEALCAAEDGVAILRRPHLSKAFSPDLAQALHARTLTCFALGRFDKEMINGATEAVNLLRDERSPTLGDIDARLAQSLSLLSRVTATQPARREESLQHAKEAVGIMEHLARLHPDPYRPDLAQMLNGLGVRQALLDQPAQALKTTQRAAEILEDLVVNGRADALRSDWSRLLDSLSFRQLKLGDKQQAAKTQWKSVCVLRRADVDPRLLGKSYGNLSYVLAAIGRHRGALLAASRYARTLRIGARRSNSDRAEYGRACTMLSVRLANLDRHEEALRAARRAVAALNLSLRHLSEPDGALADLARALNSLSLRLASLGCTNAAVRRADEAVTIARNLAKRSGNVHGADLAHFLQTVAAHEAGAGRDASRAEELAREAIEILLPPEGARTDLDTRRSLARAYCTLSDVLAHIGRGRHADACQAAQSAVDQFALFPEDAFKPLLAELVHARETLATRHREMDGEGAADT